MPHRSRVVSSLFLVLLAAGCATTTASEFAGKEPRLVPEEYFLGRHKGQGMVYDSFGNIRMSFEIDLVGELKDGALLLDETVYLGNGETDRRVYRFEKSGENRYRVVGRKVVGEGALEAYGNVLRGRYTVRQRLFGADRTLTFDDWFFLREDCVIMNRASVYKLGVWVGEVFMVITPRSAESRSCGAERSDVAVGQGREAASILRREKLELETPPEDSFEHQDELDQSEGINPEIG